jgi:hypothetical protein
MRHALFRLLPICWGICSAALKRLSAGDVQDGIGIGGLPLPSQFPRFRKCGERTATHDGEWLSGKGRATTLPSYLARNIRQRTMPGLQRSDGAFARVGPLPSSLWF